MDLSQIISQLQTGTDELQKPFDSLRSRLMLLGDALHAYECAKAANRLDLFSDRVAGLKKEIDAFEWGAFGKIDDSLPRTAKSRFKQFRNSFRDVVTGISTIAASLEFLPTDGLAQHLSNLSSSLDAFEEEGKAASTGKRWIAAACSAVILFSGSVFLFFQYWLGDIEPDSFTLLFPVDPSGRSSVLTQEKHGLHSGDFDVPDRAAFMTEFTKFYFQHRNNFLDLNYEVLPPRKKPSSETNAPIPTAPASPAAPAPPPPEEKKASYSVIHTVHSDPVAHGDSEPQPQMSAWDMENERAYRWKILLQNTSLRSPQYISSVRETIELIKEHPFPWSELRYHPIIKSRVIKPQSMYAGTQPPEIELANEGLGPAINLGLEIGTMKGERIRNVTQFHFGGRRLGRVSVLNDQTWGFVYLRRTGKKNSAIWVLDDATPVYLKIDHLPAGTPNDDVEHEKPPCFPCYPFARSNKPFVKAKDQLLKRIQTKQELTSIVESIGGSIRTTLAYEDMKGEKKEIKQDLAVPDDILIFKWNDRLLRVDSPAGAAPTRGLWFALANAFSPLDPKKTDRDALTTVFDFDMSNLPQGGVVAQGTQFDANLSALGYIAIYTTARCIRTGTYKVTVHVNGTEKLKMNFSALNPELRLFPTPKQTPDPSSLRFGRRIEIHWYRQILGLDDESYEVEKLPKDDLLITPLDPVKGHDGTWGGWEFPFDPTVVAPLVDFVEPAPAAAPAANAPAPPAEAPRPAGDVPVPPQDKKPAT